MISFEEQCLTINCEGERLLLHPKKVVFWASQSTLLAADVHVGKEHYFGRNGIAIPGGISETSLLDLFSLSAASSAKKLIILGDFMHSTPTHNESWLSNLSSLLQSHSGLDVIIVSGNHDKALGKKRVDNRIKWHDNALLCPPFIFQHKPDCDERGYVISGHLHPAWRISQSRRTSLKTPAFWFNEKYAVLPSFGAFTGGVVIDPINNTDRIYMVGPETVIQVPVQLTEKINRRNK